jgi:alkylation response protein AidB-like acyl-CoA dehydrogenase
VVPVSERIAEATPIFVAETAESNRSRRLTDLAAKKLKETGIVRLLQPTEYGGYEAHPNDFFEAVMAVGKESASVGWVASVVGIHPWEIALMDPRLQEEIWGQDPDTWTSSPYTPLGWATPVDGGFILSGQWPYSTGTDHSEWVILGGIVVSDEPTFPPDIRHFVLPRRDYAIIEDSWYVMGLEGTGSKDVRVDNLFVPDYRVVEAAKMSEGLYEDRQPGKPLYRMRFGMMFCAAVAAGTLAIAEGALAAYREYAADRISVTMVAAKTDPHQTAAYGEAAADIAASRSHLLSNIAECYDYVSSGGTLSIAQRVTFRRNQVRATTRATGAIDRLFKLAGSRAVWTTNPLQQFWRDLHTAQSHVANSAEAVYESWAAVDFGGEPSFGMW